MATTLTETTFSSTYKDDFADSAGYHRILFNSGKALQARELTQLQTILSKQIQRFGDNVFKEGAVVKPGGANINPKYEFIKLDTSTNTLPSNSSSLIGTTVTGATSQIQAKILQVVAASGSDPDTLYVQYINTEQAQASATTVAKRMQAGENMTGVTPLTVQTTDTAEDPATGVGVLVTLLSGVYYARGAFVFTEDQSKIIAKYTDNVDAEVGFKAVEDVVTASDNNSLFDNQGAVPNLTAPGADRYRILLTIATKSELSASDNFVHVATVKEGVIYNAVDPRDGYNIPNKVVAQRIFENSGDYFVKPFKIKFEEDSDNTKLKLKVSDGIAVVDGFRAARTFPTTIKLNKPTTTVTIQNEAVGTGFGNYVMVDPDVDSATQNVPNLNVFEQMTLKNGLHFTGTTLGTARVKAVDEDGAKLRYYLFDVQLNSGQAFRNVKSVGTSITNYFHPTLENSRAVIKDAQDNSSLFRLPRARPKSMTDVSFVVQRRFAPLTSNVSGEITLSISGAGETFTNLGDWIIGSDSNIISPSTRFANPTIPSGAAGTQGATISGLPANTPIEVLAYVNKSTPTFIQKTLKDRSITAAVESDGQLIGNKFINLGKADIYQVNEILKSGDSTKDLSNRFRLDNGQRDNHYALGQLKLLPGNSAPGDNIFVKYKYFEHAPDGDFFSVNSYGGQVEYDEIPGYTFSTGRRAELRNYLDFRSVMDSDGEFANTGSGARVVELPQPNTIVTLDTTYYLAQAGKLVIDRDGIVRFVYGNPGFNPTVPNKPDNTLGLYDVRLNANTDNDSDVTIRKIEHKRFTMKDIGLLEKRVDKLEEVTTLSALEIDTKHFQVLDSAGNDRTKSGFFTDNFTSHSFSAITKDEYRASIDPVTNNVRPAFKEDNIRLIYDSAASTNIIRKGDNLYLHYGERTYINQNLASKAIQINPFSVIIYEGHGTLSPASDEWRDVERLTDKIIEGGSRLAPRQAYNWNNWSWNWGGIPVENLGVGSQTNTLEGTVNKVVAEETVLDFVEDRVIQTALLPFIRSRKVKFKVEGLRPNTIVFPFFDGTLISDFARKDPTFTFYSDSDTDFGNTLKGLTAHPDGSQTLTTDANGTLIGNFIIPNNDTTKFRCGTREVMFLDISANNEPGATCVAKMNYYAQGFLDTKEATYASTRVLEVQGFRLRDNAPYVVSDGDDNTYSGGTVISDDTLVSGTDNTWSNGPDTNYGMTGGFDDANASVGGLGGDPTAGIDAHGDPGGGGGDTGGCVIATHGLTTGGFTKLEKAKAEIWCAKKYHGKLFGEAFRKGYRAAGMKHIKAGTAESVYQEFKDFVGYGRGVKKGWKLAVNYYWRTVTFIAHGLFLKG